MIGPGIIERAFELARGGDYATLTDLRRQLVREHFTSIDAHLAGFSIRRQLRRLMLNSRASHRPATHDRAARIDSRA